ncbi:ABC transporter ATP-binding protein [Cellulomonas xiejunii]|uniref:ABC transporter ATP-binding protein n=1 Tax=Cellulomonas xiejunii TaxID=2968083 RepID=A0ABY5KV48_9CELL|nr:ABC transporter ATP-binding protein [Cellulomonas xiejunii]MCC2323043.1 ABC transporter ATP-binding protein [Cellulomonas xiejunii]UUI73539.1 ABC transporter ATP-binding protein [Cellulomonas xiejunii]
MTTATTSPPSQAQDATGRPLLDVRGLTVGYTDADGRDVVLVDDVSFSVQPGEVVCLVGESGSGKSVTSLAVMGLLADPLEVRGGSILFRGRDVLAMSQAEWRAMRGKDMAMVFQDPMTALNPVRRVGTQIGRALAVHDRGLSRSARSRRVVELLTSVGVPQPAARAKGYPHEWSGGMRQRAVIAMAMANAPQLLVADEPTTALDTTVQAQVMDTLSRAREGVGASMVLITHDFGLVAQVADRVAVMYSGRIVEQGTVWDIFDRPRHPYTAGLLASMLRGPATGERAYAIPGAPPLPTARGTGCAFAPRCANPAKDPRCTSQVPELVVTVAGHPAACHHLDAPTDLTRRVS